MSDTPTRPSHRCAKHGAIRCFPRSTRRKSIGYAGLGRSGPTLREEALIRVGEPGHGLTIILSGHVDISQQDASGQRKLIVTHGPGSFMGELAQLGGRPALVDAYAKEPVEAIVIPPDKLRALLISEAELGERIMRALILRRVGLLEEGVGGPVIVGGSWKCRRTAAWQTFCRATAIRTSGSIPETDAEAKGLIERFERRPLPVADRALPERPAPAQPERDRTRALHRSGADRSIPTACTTSPWSAPDPPGWQPRSTPAPRGSPCWCSTAARSAGRPGASARIENYMGFPTGISGMALMGRAYSQAQKFGAEMAIPDEVVRAGA